MCEGIWRGWWEQCGYGRQYMHNLIIAYLSGIFSGSGYDCIGDFTLQGSHKSDGSVSFVKQYIGKHAVIYRGQNTGEGMIYGHWFTDSDTGPFALASENNIINLPINELLPGDIDK